jgi:hypothetical protein
MISVWWNSKPNYLTPFINPPTCMERARLVKGNDDDDDDDAYENTK